MIALTNKRAAKAMARLVNICEKNGFNFHRMMCKIWMKDTGQKCTNRNHLKEIYKNKMECEATMTMIISLNIKFANSSAQQIKETFKEIAG